MTKRFHERVALVTGGASGIGAATVGALADEGARVIVADIDPERGTRVAAETGARFVTLDVADGDAFAAVVDGLDQLDVLVASAFATVVAPLSALEPSGWRHTIDVTLTAAFTGLRAAVPLMRRHGRGAVVHVASLSGLGGDPGLGAYNAAKAGVINLTRTAALELAHDGIRVNAVCPGLVATPALARALERAPRWREVARAAVPLRRFGCAREVAAAILFLASDDASYVTGTTLVIDGGLGARSGIPPLAPEE